MQIPYTIKHGDKELFSHPKIVPPHPCEVNCQIAHRKWFFNTYLFLIKPFLITKFDCTLIFKAHKNVQLSLLQLYFW